MLERLFPKTVDNMYQGNVIAYILAWVITLISTGRSLAHIVLPDGGAQSIAGFPLDSYSDSAAGALVTIFNYWGGSQILMAMVFWLILLRYRALIPVLWLIVLIEYSIRLSISGIPSSLSVAPGALVNVIFVPLALVMLVLAIWHGKGQEN